MWRKTGGQWYYGIPDNLSPGTYELNYYVLDPEGYWSDPFVMNFTLNPSPPMQFNASLRALNNRFSLNSIPASEYLFAYDLWTRFPTYPTLSYALYKGSTPVTSVKNRTFNSSTDIKSGNDIAWHSFNEQIPLRSDLPDGLYTFRITATGNGQSAYRQFDVNVSTPIKLEPTMPTILLGNRSNQITAATTKYANSTSVRFFTGTPYQTIYQTMSGSQTGEIKLWSYSYIPPAHIPSGYYNAEFISTTINGNTEVKTIPFELRQNTPPTVSIVGTEPGYIYKNERLDVNFHLNDIDRDDLDIYLTLYRNGNPIFNDIFTVSPQADGTYVPIKRRISNDIQDGNYEIRIVVTDAYSETATASYNFNVHDLSITGIVEHTELWNSHRQDYNMSKSGNANSPRGNNVFFPGERFMLNADTSIIDPSRPDLIPISVTCHILNTPFSTTLSSTDRINWSGYIWDVSMLNWSDRDLTFRFTVDYSGSYGNITRTYDALARIVDDDYWRLRMKF